MNENKEVLTNGVYITDEGQLIIVMDDMCVICEVSNETN